MGKNEKVSELYVHHLKDGSILNDRYEIIRAIGEGGFGITYEGRDTLLDLRVAVKEYYPHGYANRNNESSQQVTLSMSLQKEFFEKGKKKFLNEARALAKFAGLSGIVNVRDFFEANGTAYIVMEYLDGITLKDYIKTHGTMDADELCGLMLPLLESLGKIHAAGLIHRDISPDNIMLLGNHTLVLMDFGAARDMSLVGQKSLSVMLKPGYAPEEQYRSRGKQGPWTDIYALSATMYKCLTGITPDDSTQRVFEDETKRPSELGVKISRAQEDAIMKGMSVHQTGRFQTAEAFSRALQGLEKENSSDTASTAAAEREDDAWKDRAEAAEDGDRPTIGMPRGGEAGSDEEDELTLEAVGGRAETGEDGDRLTIEISGGSEGGSEEEDRPTFEVVGGSAAATEDGDRQATEMPRGSKAGSEEEDKLTVALAGKSGKSGVTLGKQKPEPAENPGTQASERKEDPETQASGKKENPEARVAGKKENSEEQTSKEKDRSKKPGTRTAKKREDARDSEPNSSEAGKKRGMKKLVLALAAVAVLIVGGLLILQLTTGDVAISSVTVAGKEISVSATGAVFSDRDFTAEDMRKLASLKKLSYIKFDNCTFEAGAVSELTNCCSSFTELSITECSGVDCLAWISDASFSGLETLVLSDNEITYSVFSEINFDSLTSLKKLNLSGNTLTNANGADSISLASVADTLVSLAIDRTGIDDLNTLLAGCTKLETLSAAGNGITDITVLEGLPNLTTIILSDNEIQTISALKSCEKLVTLDLKNNQIESLDGLSNCTKLEALYVDGNAIQNLDGIETAICLKYISASNNALTDIDGLQNATILAEVNFDGTGLDEESLALLEKSSATLDYVSLADNALTELSFLADATSLEYLNVDNNELTFIDELANMTTLKAFSADNNQLFSISSLESSTELVYLSIAGNQLTNAEPFASFASKGNDFRLIDVSGNALSLVTKLNDYTCDYLAIYDNDLAVAFYTDFFEGVSGKHLWFTYVDGMSYEGISGFGAYTETDCPLDSQLAALDALNRYSGDENLTFATVEEAAAEFAEVKAEVWEQLTENLKINQ